MIGPTLNNNNNNNTDLNPADKDGNGDGRVEGDLVEGKSVEVGEFFRLGKQLVQLVVDSIRAIQVEDDAADGHYDHNDVENVPERLEVGQTNFLDLHSTSHIQLQGYHLPIHIRQYQTYSSSRRHI